MTNRDKSIDRVLAAVQIRFGLGPVRDLPWIRDRVGAFLEGQLERSGCSWTDVADHVIKHDLLMKELIGSLRVGETRFFRDPEQIETVVQHVCATIPASETILALSAGCSTGEEVYTLGILFADKGRKFQVHGVDRSEEAIQAAKQARYSYEAAREVPMVLVKRHFDDDGTALTVRAAIRSNVSFEVRDLMVRTPRGPYHLIVFKNVLIYLADAVGTLVASRLANELVEGGILVSAASEVVRLSGDLERVRLPRGVVAFRPRPRARPPSRR